MEAECEYGFEKFMCKYGVEGLVRSEYKRFAPVIITEVESLQNTSTGVISALGTLQVGYNEMKEHLDLAGPSTGLLPPTSIINDINTTMEKIKTYWKIKETVELNSKSGGSVDATHHSSSICARRVQLKNTGWESNNTSSKLISKVISSSTVNRASFLTKPALKVYSRKEKRDPSLELRRRTVQRQLVVPE